MSLDNLKIMRNKPTFHDFIVSVDINGVANFIYEIGDVLVEDSICNWLDGSKLIDNITSEKNMPIEPGIYKCRFKYYSFTCNIPIDPVEYDYIFEIEECHKMNIVV